MNLFNIPIDNDITYLLSELGHNIKINNVAAKGIINNASMERTFDDKRLITNAELKRGYYINYNDLNFLVLNEINDKRLSSYYKGIIRHCNFDLKFIIDNKLYLFYSCIEGDKFSLQKGIITYSADTITVTLPYTPITNQLKIGDSFISMGSVWKIEGIDYTKVGIINLYSKKDAISTTDDDLQNKIADRYDRGVDRLNGNITPILPFDEVEEPEEPTLPETPVEPEPPADNFTYELQGSSTLTLNQTGIYTAVKKNNNEVVEAGFNWTIDYKGNATSTVSIVEETNTNIKLKGSSNNSHVGKYFRLIATDTETGDIVEKDIMIKSLF
ncbi:hypothetical protein [Alkaliphilus sp. B6464]|uniref:hypothetical protein n=1 Tax=Alkaliphilus sp. B6464 TaxID=2731219 RepID=UPI001BA6F624|nr:hypothetical protein [Alkaliphilus sp. B6464]QUH20228.1 hypothetical protein HYG84_10115 [Alkaliphilus sp. B6464]